MPDDREPLVSRCEALLWQALQGRGWLKLREIACAAGMADQTAYQILVALVHQGLAERVRLGLPCYYRLAPAAAGARAYARRVERTRAVLEARGAAAAAGCPRRAA